MQMHFFAIAALNPAAGHAELNQFLGAHRITRIERQFVPAGADLHWAVCVSIVTCQRPLLQPLSVIAQVNTARRHAPEWPPLLGRP